MAVDLSKFRPNLAAETSDYDWSLLKYPVYVSPKLDGIRCVVHPISGPISRSLKPIKNDNIRNYLSVPEFKWLDGELLVDDYNAPDAFQKAQSGVMSQGGTPNWTYYVFDNFQAGNTCGFGIRLGDAEQTIINAHTAMEIPAEFVRVKLLQHKLVDNYEELVAAEEEALADGFEGLMIRSPGGKYKFGRSTQREQGLLKMKRFLDDEGIITGWEPLLRNLNDPTIDAMGLQKRGYSKDGKVPDYSRIGKYHAVGAPGSRWAGTPFAIGSGLDDNARLTGRANVSADIGRKFSYKYQSHGSKDAPRTPIWKGFRGDE